jgi:hypothetical protein
MAMIIPGRFWSEGIAPQRIAVKRIARRRIAKQRGQFIR